MYCPNCHHVVSSETVCKYCQYPLTIQQELYVSQDPLSELSEEFAEPKRPKSVSLFLRFACLLLILLLAGGILYLSFYTLRRVTSSDSKAAADETDRSYQEAYGQMIAQLGAYEDLPSDIAIGKTRLSYYSFDSDGELLYEGKILDEPTDYLASGQKLFAVISYGKPNELYTLENLYYEAIQWDDDHIKDAFVSKEVFENDLAYSSANEQLLLNESLEGIRLLKDLHAFEDRFDPALYANSEDLSESEETALKDQVLTGVFYFLEQSETVSRDQIRRIKVTRGEYDGSIESATPDSFGNIQEYYDEPCHTTGCLLEIQYTDSKGRSAAAAVQIESSIYSDDHQIHVVYSMPSQKEIDRKKFTQDPIFYEMEDLYTSDTFPSSFTESYVLNVCRDIRFRDSFTYLHNSYGYFARTCDPNHLRIDGIKAAEYPLIGKCYYYVYITDNSFDQPLSYTEVFSLQKDASSETCFTSDIINDYLMGIAQPSRQQIREGAQIRVHSLDLNGFFKALYE